MHKHHILPKHSGGTDHPDNLIELTVEEHAEAHRKLWEEHGKWQDKLAWQTLSGQIGKEEATKIAQRMGQLGRKHPYRPRPKAKGRKAWNQGLTKENHPSLKKLSRIAKRQMREGRLSNIGDYQRGRTKTDEERANLRIAQSKIPNKVCENCGISVRPCMYARWHGSNCRKV